MKVKWERMALTRTRRWFLSGGKGEVRIREERIKPHISSMQPCWRDVTGADTPCSDSPAQWHHTSTAPHQSTGSAVATISESDTDNPDLKKMQRCGSVETARGKLIRWFLFKTFQPRKQKEKTSNLGALQIYLKIHFTKLIRGLRRHWHMKFSKPHKVEQNISHSTNPILLSKTSLGNGL